VTVGQGTIDGVKTFAAARTGGVESYFVEQTWKLTKPSVAYLNTRKVEEPVATDPGRLERNLDVAQPLLSS
jgi:hypothetical protein